MSVIENKKKLKNFKNGRIADRSERVNRGRQGDPRSTTKAPPTKKPWLPPNEFPGERHGFIFRGFTPRRARFMGPGTNLDVRIKRRDRGLSAVDRAAKAHDLRYSLSEGRADEKAADQKFIQVVNKIQEQKKDDPKTIAQAKLVNMKDALGIPAKWFTKIGGKKNHPDGPLFQTELQKLEREGY